MRNLFGGAYTWRGLFSEFYGNSGFEGQLWEKMTFGPHFVFNIVIS